VVLANWSSGWRGSGTPTNARATNRDLSHTRQGGRQQPQGGPVQGCNGYHELPPFPFHSELLKSVEPKASCCLADPVSPLLPISLVLCISWRPGSLVASDLQLTKS
jgi:hypothetical protein